MPSTEQSRVYHHRECKITMVKLPPPCLVGPKGPLAPWASHRAVVRYLRSSIAAVILYRRPILLLIVPEPPGYALDRKEQLFDRVGRGDLDHGCAMALHGGCAYRKLRPPRKPMIWSPAVRALRRRRRSDWPNQDAAQRHQSPINLTTKSEQTSQIPCSRPRVPCSRPRVPCSAQKVPCFFPV